jgi:hypothetical protein
MTAIFALTSVALRAPSVSAKAELLTLLRIGTFYFALTEEDMGLTLQGGWTRILIAKAGCFR